MLDEILSLIGANLGELLKLTESDRPNSQKPNGFDAKEWHAVCNGQQEILIKQTTKLVDAAKKAQEQAQEELTLKVIEDPEPEPVRRKPGRYMGTTGDRIVRNGDFYDE